MSGSSSLAIGGDKPGTPNHVALTRLHRFCAPLPPTVDTGRHRTPPILDELRERPGPEDHVALTTRSSPCPLPKGVRARRISGPFRGAPLCVHNSF